MRLVDCEDLSLKEFPPDRIPPYAILSHTWREDGQEVTYQDMLTRRKKLRTILPNDRFRKIDRAATQALNDGLEYLWVDTCCIDKLSSAELSEAINSMYQWYAKSSRCYVVLEDLNCTRSDANFRAKFAGTRWLTRGWTLQELLAPQYVEFFNANWDHLGEKGQREFGNLISDLTAIPIGVLTRRAPLSSQSVAARMSWVANRRTTRPEDIAYCLLGIFEVNMPLLYGEGMRAFLRLQEEIMKRSTDQSLFAWGLESQITVYHDEQYAETQGYFLRTERSQGILASRPAQFLKSSQVAAVRAGSSPYAMTNGGLQISLPIIRLPGQSKGALAVLKCGFARQADMRLAIYVVQTRGDENVFARAAGRAAVLIPPAVVQNIIPLQIYLQNDDYELPHLEIRSHCAVEFTDGRIQIEGCSPSEAWDRLTKTIDIRELPAQQRIRNCKVLLRVDGIPPSSSTTSIPEESQPSPLRILVELQFFVHQKQQAAVFSCSVLEDASSIIRRRSQKNEKPTDKSNDPSSPPSKPLRRFTLPINVDGSSPKIGNISKLGHRKVSEGASIPRMAVWNKAASSEEPTPVSTPQPEPAPVEDEELAFAWDQLWPIGLEKSSTPNEATSPDKKPPIFTRTRQLIKLNDESRLHASISSGEDLGEQIYVMRLDVGPLMGGEVTAQDTVLQGPIKSRTLDAIYW